MDKSLLSPFNLQKSKTKSVRFSGSVKNALLEFDQGSKQAYQYLLTAIADENNKSSQIMEWYEDAMMNAHLLDKRYIALVKTLISVSWTDREKEVITQFHKFVLALITSNPVHLRLVLKKLTLKFQDVALESDDSNLPFNSFALETIHSIFKTAFSVIPQSLVMVEAVFSECYPFMRKSLSVLDNYAKHLLLVTSYQPSLRPCIIELILKNLVQLDAYSPKHDIEEAELADENEDEIFQMDEDIHNKSDLDNPDQPKKLEMKHPLADSLDALLLTLYRYIQGACFRNGELQLEEARKLFREMVFAFDRVVLPIHQLSHVQFVIFYICSFKQSFYDSFIDFCWKKVTDVNTSAVIRKASVCYIASLLARANYIPLSTAKACLEMMTDWCERYLKQTSHLHTATVTSIDELLRHGPFYSVCQAIFYIIAFRHQQILDSNKGHNYIQSLNLQHLITSPLNPLKACLGSVVTVFASTMRAHQLVYCDSIIERNNRQMVPVVGSYSSSDSQFNLLDSYFPFDPYLLKRSLKFIEPLYTNWSGSVPTSSHTDVQDTHDDDFLNAVEEGSRAMSMRECGSDLAVACSASPGFGYFISPKS